MNIFWTLFLIVNLCVITYHNTSSQYYDCTENCNKFTLFLISKSKNLEFITQCCLSGHLSLIVCEYFFQKNKIYKLKLFNIFGLINLIMIVCFNNLICSYHSNDNNEFRIAYNEYMNKVDFFDSTRLITYYYLVLEYLILCLFFAVVEYLMLCFVFKQPICFPNI